jgi:hypothetical protein
MEMLYSAAVILATPQRFSRLSEVSALLACEWPAIHKAIARSESELADLQILFSTKDGNALANNCSLVLFGSLARCEFSDQSDLDWILLVDGNYEDSHLSVVKTVNQKLAASNKIGPASGGIFGSLVLSDCIVDSIGADKTIRELSLRMLLLLESVSIGDDKAARRVIHTVLQTYLTRNKNRTWQCLLEDIIHFGQTMGVDLAGSLPDGSGSGWGLRNAKRRFSRKLIVLTGFLGCQRRHDGFWQGSNDLIDETRLDELGRFFSRPPLEILADELLLRNTSNPVLRKIFSSYDQFLRLLDDPASRNELQNTSCEFASKSIVYRLVQEISQEFQDAIWQACPAVGTLRL